AQPSWDLSTRRQASGPDQATNTVQTGCAAQQTCGVTRRIDFAHDQPRPNPTCVTEQQHQQQPQHRSTLNINTIVHLWPLPSLPKLGQHGPYMAATHSEAQRSIVTMPVPLAIGIRRKDGRKDRTPPQLPQCRFTSPFLLAVITCCPKTIRLWAPTF
ncbi:hypothetical protein Vretifemale_14019, partial [Volvox reticuliferus]